MKSLGFKLDDEDDDDGEKYRISTNQTDNS